MEAYPSIDNTETTNLSDLNFNTRFVNFNNNEKLLLTENLDGISPYASKLYDLNLNDSSSTQIYNENNVQYENDSHGSSHVSQHIRELIGLNTFSSSIKSKPFSNRSDYSYCGSDLTPDKSIISCKDDQYDDSNISLLKEKVRPDIDLIYRTFPNNLLAKACAEIARKRPSNPIRYLAFYLINYKQNIIRNERFAQDLETMQLYKQEMDPLEALSIQEEQELDLLPPNEDEMELETQIGEQVDYESNAV